MQIWSHVNVIFFPIIVCFTHTSLTVQFNYTSSITSLTILLPLPPTTITGDLPPPNVGYKLDFEICRHQTWATVHQDLNKMCLLPTIQHQFTNHRGVGASKIIIKSNNKICGCPAQGSHWGKPGRLFSFLAYQEKTVKAPHK